MALFSRSKPAEETPPASESAALDHNRIVADVVNALKPMLQQQQQQPVTTAATGEDDVDELEPGMAARIQREVQTATKPYVDSYAAAIPTIVRDNVVARLSEGEREIYNKYKAEVDQSIAVASQRNPALAADPQIHQRAIHMVLGAHASEIEQLVINRLKPEDLPPTFVGLNNGTNVDVKQVTPEERQRVDYYNQSSRNRNWTPEDTAYYNDIPNGTVAEMVAAHRAKKENKGV